MDKTEEQRLAHSVEYHPKLQKASELHTRQLSKQNQLINCALSCFGSIAIGSAIAWITQGILTRGSSDPGFFIYSFLLAVKLLFIILFQIFYSSALMIAEILIREHNPESIFFLSVLRKFIPKLSWIASFASLYFIPSCYDLAASQDIYNAFTDANKGSTEKEGIDRRIIFSLLCFILTFFFRDIIIFGLNFNVHYKYYVNRINLNIEKITLLKLINEKINAGYGESIDTICERLVKQISKNGSTITLFDLLEYFDQASADKIMDFCKSEEDDQEISGDDIRGFYFQTLLEQNQISKSLDQNDTSVNESKTILDIIFIPTACVYFIKNINIFDSDKLLDYKLIGALIFSTSYTSSEAIKQFILSFHFVFLVRPYEVDDVIILEDKEYKVQEINILTTVLSRNLKSTVFPNTWIAAKPVTNLRLKRVWDEKYTYKFNIDKFEAKKDDFLSKLTLLLKKHPSEYRKKPFFMDISIIEKDKITATLVVGFNLDTGDLNIIRERKNKFLFRLNQVFRESELLPFVE